LLTVSGRLYGDSPSAHVPTWTGDCFELAKSWITDCQVAHISHCSQNVLKDFEPYWPTILLYVGDLLRDLRLDETSFIASALPAREYLALSYCRSQNGLPMAQKLTLTKKDEWKRHINREDLPLTFQHAIQFTRQLGFKYLWIDALCIIQDCPELWKYETQNMGKVFANAHCTIATSSDANSGLFHQRTSSLLDFPCHLRFSKKIAMTIRAKRHTYSSKSFAEEVDRKKLSWQAQGFQERLVSRRILHFGPKFLFFECNTHIASEAMIAGQLFREKLWFWERLYHAKRRKFQLQSNAIHSVFNPVTGYRGSFNELRANRSTTLSLKEELHLHKTWFELVCRFTRSNMMEPSDRTLAIMGLSQAVQDREEKL
jgi:Heterokaryon incompatibility protein (HET)